jgi:hypothetical protein
MNCVNEDCSINMVKLTLASDSYSATTKTNSCLIFQWKAGDRSLKLFVKDQRFQWD